MELIKRLEILAEVLEEQAISHRKEIEQYPNVEWLRGYNGGCASTQEWVAKWIRERLQEQEIGTNDTVHSTGSS